MCRAVSCKTCGTTTWAGCGLHVDHVMRRVSMPQRCTGHEPAPQMWTRGLRRLRRCLPDPPTIDRKMYHHWPSVY
jgi:hypothetical protein